VEDKPAIIDQDESENKEVRSFSPGVVHHRQARPPRERRTAKQIAVQAKLLQQVVAEVMQKDVHYGIIPGTAKPTLYKAGAEKLLSTFNIAVIPEIIDLSTDDSVRYQVKAKGVHQHSNITLGVGVGECSTDEEKYKWRAAVCEEEFIDTEETRRRTKFKRDYQGVVTRVQQVRTEPADLANTVLKMAKKRAQIDLTLTVTGASDMFTQDLDDDGNLIPRGEPARRQTIAGKTGSGKKATPGQVSLIGVKLDQSGKDIENLKEAYSVDSIEDLTMDQVNEVLEWLQK